VPPSIVTLRSTRNSPSASRPGAGSRRARRGRTGRRGLRGRTRPSADTRPSSVDRRAEQAVDRSSALELDSPAGSDPHTAGTARCRPRAPGRRRDARPGTLRSHRTSRHPAPPRNPRTETTRGIGDRAPLPVCRSPRPDERKLGPSSISKAAAISHRRAGLTTVQNLPTREIRSIQDGSGPEGGSLIASLDTESMG